MQTAHRCIISNTIYKCVKKRVKHPPPRWFYCTFIENHLRMLARYRGVKKHTPKGMLAKRGSQENNVGFISSTQEM